MLTKVQPILEKDITVLHSFTLLATFLTLAPLTILACFLALFSLATTTREPLTQNLPELNLLEAPRFGARVYAALPSTQPIVSTSAQIADARAEIVRQYLERYNSPLVPYADLIVSISDQYNLDWRLLVAIAQQESNLCKKVPDGTFNCWGWGIHSRGTLGFTDYKSAIETVAKGIREKYLDQGFDTVEKIMSKYTPLSNGSWAAGVNQFLAEME